MNFILVTSSLLLALSHFSIQLVHSLDDDSSLSTLSRVKRGPAGREKVSGKSFITALSAVARGREGGDAVGDAGDSYELGQSSSSSSGSEPNSSPLDRNMVVACTNRHNCEMTCAKVKTAKYASKAAFLDALVRSIGEEALTDAHKLGLQFGRRRSCEKCALVYSNCDNNLYGIARQTLFAWRSSPDDLMSLPKSSNNL